ncbi:MAG: response regulator [Ignavibacteria bacterium]|jgi:CheY-like chemotaxis protein|nr:response regulator [Ignavibacteria bacterium]MDH7526786.1 response regulator [Ignavibacteria bacterium]
MSKILIVEDDPFNVELFDLILKRLGNFETVVTDNFEKIFEELRNGSVDLVVMDVSLDNTYYERKKIDGIVLSRMIKEDEQLKHIPVIIVTAYAGDDDISRILRESRAEQCIKKPIINYKEFINLIKGYLR